MGAKPRARYLPVVKPARKPTKTTTLRDLQEGIFPLVPGSEILSTGHPRECRRCDKTFAPGSSGVHTCNAANKDPAPLPRAHADIPARWTWEKCRHCDGRGYHQSFIGRQTCNYCKQGYSWQLIEPPSPL